MSNKTITVKGRTYDAVTGLPVNKRSEASARATTELRPGRREVSATAVHKRTQKSNILRRTAVKKPEAIKRTQPTVGKKRTMDIAINPRVSKFAPHPVASKKFSTKDVNDVKPPQPHPIAERAIKKLSAKKTTKTSPVATKLPTAKELKDRAIKEAMAKTDTKVLHTTKKRSRKLRAKLPSIHESWDKRLIWGVLAVLLVAVVGWSVFNFIPSISVSIAAQQAGVEASYPQYIPDGFRLHQPVTYTDGEVKLDFASNSNDDSYTITQTKSSWDSSAVLDNIVKPTAGDNYLTTTEKGLTIYTYDSSAVWVNGGVLYKIVSDAHLSNEQIRKIATSL